MQMLDPLHETIDHLFLAGLLARDGELVAVDLHHMAVAEFLVEHAVIDREFRSRAGRFRDQFAFDGHRRALAARKAAGEGIAARAGERRLLLVEAVACPAAAFGLTARAVGLGALPARRRIARAERFHIIEPRGTITAGSAPARAALGFGDLDAGRRQFVEEARRD